MEIVEDRSKILREFSPENVCLVQDYDRPDPIDLAGHEKAVEKWEFQFGEGESHDKEGPVYVGRDDVVLTGQVGGLAYEIVAAGMDRGYRRRALRTVRLVVHNVPYGHRIGGGTTPEAYPASEHCREKFPLRELREEIMAPRMLDYRCRTFHRRQRYANERKDS